MKKNLNLEGNIQYFLDTTYKFIPPQSSGMKLFVIVTYNKKLNKTLLCNLSLIYNENVETIEKLLEFLKDVYNFNPNLITIDLGKAGYKAVTNIFPKCRIFPCYFHIIRRFILHIKNLNSKNKQLKKNAKDLLFNIKILLFIDYDQIDYYYNLIKNRYYKNNEKFFKYFDRTYLKNKPFSDRQWNYSKYINTNEDISKYFFTNNIVERLNRTLNNIYKNTNRSFLFFAKAINKIIDIYNNHSEYIEKGISITRVLAWWCKNNNIISLKNEKDKENMIKEYKRKFILNSNDKNKEINDLDEDLIIKDNDYEISSSNLSSNFHSNSSSSDSKSSIENNIISNINNKDDDNDDGSDSNINTNIISKTGKIINNNIKNKNEKKQTKRNDQKCNKHMIYDEKYYIYINNRNLLSYNILLRCM